MSENFHTPGEIICRRYRVLQFMGHGGVGAVYKVEDMKEGTIWAVKQALPQGGRDAVRAMQHESRVLARLNHPAIPGVKEILSLWNRYYLVREFIDGHNLRSRLEVNRLPEETEVLWWAVQVTDILSYLHSLTVPVVVADLKPGNLMLDKANSLHLVDLGMAGQICRGCANPTGGTMGYAAPEQFLGHFGPRSDIYALGATMYHLLTGRKLDHRQPGSNLTPPHQLREGLTPGTSSIVLKALAYNMADRYVSATEMKGRLLTQWKMLDHMARESASTTV